MQSSHQSRAVVTSYFSSGRPDGDGLITRGVGFIGSHLTDELLEAGYSVRVLDNLSPQVHGEARSAPQYLNHDVELIVGDLRNPGALRQALRGVHYVFLLAAAVGAGQSMCKVAEYYSVNESDTACLVEALIERPEARGMTGFSSALPDARFGGRADHDRR